MPGYNHYPWCSCGWCYKYGSCGGPRILPSPPSKGFASSKSGASSSSMTELAAELGHSVIFPVICRYCGEEVYLFAAPDGGFTIFDELGPPWPRHQCEGFNQNRTVDCSFQESRSSRYRLPVPDSMLFSPPPKNSNLFGIVVAIRRRTNDRSESQLWETDIYTKKRLSRILCERAFQIGSCVEGIVTYIQGIGTFLSDAKAFDPFEVKPIEQSNEKSTELEKSEPKVKNEISHTPLAHFEGKGTTLEVWESQRMGVILIYDPEAQIDVPEGKTVFWVYSEERWMVPLNDFQMKKHLIPLDQKLASEIMQKYMNNRPLPPKQPQQFPWGNWGNW